MGVRGVTMISKRVTQSTKIPAWTTRFTATAVVILMINGCVSSEQYTAVSTADTKTVTVAGQDVTLGSVVGYCFNNHLSKIVTSGAFVVLAPCNPDDKDKEAKGLILINILAKKDSINIISTQDLEADFQSDIGRAALSRKGKATNLTVLGTMQDNGVYYVHTQDIDGPVVPDTTDDQWRAFMVVANSLVSVRVVNFKDDKMTDGLVFAYMEAIAKRIQALN